MKLKKYLLFIYDDIEPEIMGPYDTDEDRDRVAKELREAHGNKHGIYKLDGVHETNIETYSGAFFEEEEEDE